MKSRFLVLILSGIAGAAFAATNVMPVDGYAAMVNNRVITIGDVITYVQPLEQSLRDQFTGAQLQKKREEAFETGLQALIDRALILEDFDSQPAKLPDRVVNDRIGELVREQFKGDRLAFQQALVDEGLTLDEWRTETKNRIVISILRQQEVSSKVKIAPNAARELYDARKNQYAVPAQVHLHVISIHRGTPSDPNAGHDKAVVARGKLLTGDDFEDVAKAYSDGSKADAGGDWGWMDPSSLRADLKAAVDHLPVGEASDIIEADDAYYILRVDDRRPAGFRPFSEIEPKLTEELKQADADRLYKEWMQRLRRKYYVQIF